jgi:hypothetical protein
VRLSGEWRSGARFAAALNGFGGFGGSDAFGGGLLCLGFHRWTSAGTQRLRRGPHRSSPTGRRLLPQASQWLQGCRRLWRPRWARGHRQLLSQR